MKQMITNHREIESLQDFVYYGSDGKIHVKKDLVDKDGNPVGGGSKIEVEDITDISQEILNNLSAGDIIIQKNNDGDMWYVCVMKTNIIMWLMSDTYELPYKYNEGESKWIYDPDDEYTLVGTQLYCHKIGITLIDGETPNNDLVIFVYSTDNTSLLGSNFIDLVMIGGRFSDFNGLGIVSMYASSGQMDTTISPLFISGTSSEHYLVYFDATVSGNFVSTKIHDGSDYSKVYFDSITPYF